MATGFIEDLEYGSMWGICIDAAVRGIRQPPWLPVGHAEMSASGPLTASYQV